jgi:hypothetical protein
MMEDAQKKAKRVGMPIVDIELVMMASAAVLAAQHFPCKVTDWEGCPAIDHTLRVWKVEFRQAHIRCQRQLQASEGGKLLSGAHTVHPAPAGTIDCLGTALNNHALAAANDTTVLQQLSAASLALTATNALLMTANKRLSEALAKLQATKPGTPGTPCLSTKSFPGNYCWTHGFCVNQTHTSATCSGKGAGHQDVVTASDTIGSSQKDKGWHTR